MRVSLCLNVLYTLIKIVVEVSSNATYLSGDGLDYHDGLKFSTYDQDSTQGLTDCAKLYRGAWWYRRCSHSSLNGEYIKGTNGTANKNMGVNWEKFKGDNYSLKSASMMLRRKT